VALFAAKKSPDPVRVFEFIEVEKSNFSIKLMYNHLGDTRQGFYARRGTVSKCV
jgi:hypothetical protein